MTTKLWTKLAGSALTAVIAISAAATANASAAPAAPMARSQAEESAVPSPSTRVSGVLTDPQGLPLAGVELHFQGRISHDMYTIHTRARGSFSIALPPGLYDLRGEHGEIITSGVRVGERAVHLGHVQTPAPLAPTRLFDRQTIGEAIVQSQAPSGARVRPSGGGVGAVAVIPAPHPVVQGGTPEGKAKAPAQVIPTEIEKQLELPQSPQPKIGAPSS